MLCVATCDPASTLFTTIHQSSRPSTNSPGLFLSRYRVSAGSTLHITVYDKLNLAESFLSKVRQKGYAEPSCHQADVLVERRWVLLQLQQSVML
jgi:hypothetical protein